MVEHTCEWAPNALRHIGTRIPLQHSQDHSIKITSNPSAWCNRNRENVFQTRRVKPIARHTRNAFVARAVIKIIALLSHLVACQHHGQERRVAGRYRPVQGTPGRHQDDRTTRSAPGRSRSFRRGENAQIRVMATHLDDGCPKHVASRHIWGFGEGVDHGEPVSRSDTYLVGMTPRRPNSGVP